MADLDRASVRANIASLCNNLLRYWQSDGRWQYALVYKNQGERAGATLEHAHSQLIILPRLPGNSSMNSRASRNILPRRKCIYCDISVGNGAPGASGFEPR